MTKYLFLILALSIVSLNLDAREKVEHERAAKKGNIIFSAGYGAPSIIRTFLKYKTTRDQITVSGTGPYILKGEYMLNKRLGIGFNAAYNQSKVRWEDFGYDTIQFIYRKFEFGIKAYELSGALRLNYHFWHRKKIDAYAGLGVGSMVARMWSYTKAHTTKFGIEYDLPPPLIMEATCGFRYFATKRIGFYTELGIGKSWVLWDKYFLPEAVVQAGLILKL